MTNIHIPIACSATAEASAKQLVDWTDLSLISDRTSSLPGGVAMVFDMAHVEAVEVLAAKERSCCSFLSITTSRSADKIRLEISSDNPDAYTIISQIAGVPVA
jgi:hypothetical protein